MAKPFWEKDRKLIWRCTNRKCLKVHEAGSRVCLKCGFKVTDVGRFTTEGRREPR